MLSRGERIVAQGSIRIALQFGNIAEIVQSERVVGIEQIRLIEELLGLVLMAMLEFGHPLAIEPLAGRGYAFPRNRDTQIAGEPEACPGEKLQRQQPWNRTESSCFVKVHHGAGIMMCGSPVWLTTANTLDRCLPSEMAELSIQASDAKTLPCPDPTGRLCTSPDGPGRARRDSGHAGC